MSLGHACVGSTSTIRFQDASGRTIVVFKRMCDGNYFGGITHPEVPYMHGAHVQASVGVLFNLIARLAHETEDPRAYFSMDGNNWNAIIRQEMQADDIAKVLGCPVDEVTRHFSFLIKVVEKSDEPG